MKNNDELVKCQCRNCGRILDFNKVKNPKVINDFGHFKFIEDCSYCKDCNEVAK